MTSTDHELLDRAIAGDGDALAELLAQHGPRVKCLIAPLIPRRWRAMLAAEDVMQDTYLEAFRDLPRFDPRGEHSFGAWLLTAAKRNLLDTVRTLEADKRGHGRRPIAMNSAEDALFALYQHLTRSPSSPSRQVAREEACASLRQAMERLPARHRIGVQLYYLDGCSIDDVARAMRCTPGAAYMLLRRARERLNELLGTYSRYFSG